MFDLAGFPISFQRLVRELGKLPSVGSKTAFRLAYHLLAVDPELGGTLSAAIREVKEKVKLCEQCFFISEDRECSICRNTARDRSVLCVVEKPLDVISIERSGEYRGLYHVLHGLWAPLRGQSADSMRLKELVARVAVQKGSLREVILATSSTVEGDATAAYIVRLLQEQGVSTTRLAQGLPKGGELEYADDLTLSYAFTGRKAMP